MTGTKPTRFDCNALMVSASPITEGVMPTTSYPPIASMCMRHVPAINRWVRWGVAATVHNRAKLQCRGLRRGTMHWHAKLKRYAHGATSV